MDRKDERKLFKKRKNLLEMDLDDPSLMMEVAAGMIDNSGKKLSILCT